MTPRREPDPAELRILLVGPGPGTRGGIAQFNRHLAAALEGGGFAVTTLAFRKLYPGWTRPGKQGSDPSRRRSTDSDTVRVLVPWSPLSWVSGARTIRRTDPAMVVFQWWHPMFSPCYLALTAVARLSGARVAYVCHNVQPHEPFLLARSLTRLALARSACLFALSDAVERELHELAPRVPVKNLGHPPYGELMISSDEARTRWTERIPKRDRRVLLFFGNVRPYKGLMDLIDALPRVLAEEAVLLVVAGTFFERLEAYRARIRELNLVDHVFLFPEYVPDEEVAALFEVADLVVLPYRSGTQTGVVPLAVEFQKPVVVTSVGGIGEAAGSAAHVSPPGRPEALARAIVDALRSSTAPRSAPAATWAAWVAEVRDLTRSPGGRDPADSQEG